MRRTVTSLAGFACLLFLVLTQNSLAQSCDSGLSEGAYDSEVVLPQNLNCEERQEFWFTDQGSQIIPYKWFLQLEQPDNSNKFADPANMDEYRYLPKKPTARNPDGLPVGFTKGSAKSNRAYGKISNDWLGMTCAACHTGQVEFEGNKFLIDGAPAMADFEGMVLDLAASMKATLADEAKFERFAAAVGGDKDTLRGQLEQITKVRNDWNKLNAGKSRYGHARLDALGAIYNAVAVTALGQPANRNDADAPVSYPFIWDTPQHDKVQWNGSVPNAGPGALGRNVGEVIGVFGALELNLRRSSRSGHRNSANFRNLGRLEALVTKMWSPEWENTSLPQIDAALANKGRPVFEKFCLSCHADIDRTNPDRKIKAVMVPVANPDDADDPDALRTDPTMATNFISKMSRNPDAKNLFKRYWLFLSERERLDDPARNAKLLGFAAVGVITRGFFEDPLGTIEALKAGQPPVIVGAIERAKRHISGDKDPRTGLAKKSEIRRALVEIRRATRSYRKEQNVSNARAEDDGLLGRIERVRGRLRSSRDRIGSLFMDEDDRTEDDCPLCYKARPLNGIWATAPYLHNGSVRTMRQLLLPAACPTDAAGTPVYLEGRCRQITFNVGSREFDPVDMGFNDSGASTLDTSLPGNSNAGHDGPSYGNPELAANPDMLNALLEYLKTL